MVWLVLLLLAVGLTAAVLHKRQTPTAYSPEAILKAALKLHTFRQRFLIARTRREIRRDAEVVRRRLAKELAAMRPHDFEDREPRS
jgi:hypothetical protein